ncbi:MAG: hypothetical protein QMD85_00785 [Candidatus Aenigmarchaeota archaeon]|nr:hypothetical protein [Candidatus Aenigmarchaeota archaeon]MDI6722073.1 hypothetical protein [Candidatus Aenigmarchaeota archaeon]
MYSSGVKDVLESIKNITQKGDGDPVLERYKTFPFSRENFMELKPKDAKLAFIDGGNAEIIHTPSFSVFLIRTYYNVFLQSEKSFAKRQEFYALSWTDENLFYKTKLFPLTQDCLMPYEKDLLIKISDPTIKDGIFSADISKMGSVIRKFAEWKMTSCIKEKNCIVVKDGTLRPGITNGDAYAIESFSEAEKNSSVVASVAKTSAIFTTTGNNFLSVLQKSAPFKSWHYSLIGENENTFVCAAKFHPSSRHAFRADVMKSADIQHVLSCITSNCNDYRFPGYPYGLIDADTFARVTESDKAYHRTLFLSASKDHMPHISSGDAHDILNSLVR